MSDFPPSKYKNIVQDVHLYQLFSDYDRGLSLSGHIEKTTTEWPRMIRLLQKKLPVMIGEWSLALAGDTQGIMDKNTALKKYANAQVKTFEAAKAGWFFWTYKTETIPEWSLKESVNNGWLAIP